MCVLAHGRDRNVLVGDMLLLDVWRRPQHCCAGWSNCCLGCMQPYEGRAMRQQCGSVSGSAVHCIVSLLFDLVLNCIANLSACSWQFAVVRGDLLAVCLFQLH